MSEDRAAAAPTAAREGPPARPAMVSALPSPLVRFTQPRPRVLTLSVAIWILSGLAGLAIVGYFVSRLDGVRALLTTTMRTKDPDVDDTSLQTAINSTIAIALGLIGLFIALKLLLALVMAARRNWARVLLAIVGVLALPVTAVGATLLTVGTVETRGWLLFTIVAQEVLMLAGMVTMFLPAPNSWFRLRPRLR